MAEPKKPSLRHKVEAVLFSTGHRIKLDDISRLCRSSKEDVLAALNDLKREYEEKQSSLMLVDDGEFWKLTVRDHLIPVVRKIVTETELTKSVLETLAVIAFKYPILQSDLIKIRTNKAYDHLVELEKSGYISRQKHSRTNLIKLTEKFFRYFDLTEEKLKERFKDFGSIARAIQEKELEIEQIRDDQRKKAEELKKEDERIKKEIETLDAAGEEFEVPLQVYDAKQEKTTIANLLEPNKSAQEKIANLEVIDIKNDIVQRQVQKEAKQVLPYDEEGSSAQKSETSQIYESQESESKSTKPIDSSGAKKGRGIKLSKEMQVRVEQRVQELIQGKEETKEKK